MVLSRRLHAALTKLNPHLPVEAVDEVFDKVVHLTQEYPSLALNNRTFHRWRREGITMEVETPAEIYGMNGESAGIPLETHHK